MTKSSRFKNEENGTKSKTKYNWEKTKWYGNSLDMAQQEPKESIRFFNPTSSSGEHRKTGEPVTDYIAAIRVRAQARRCNFNGLKNHLVWDRIVCSIR